MKMVRRKNETIKRTDPSIISNTCRDEKTINPRDEGRDWEEKKNSAQENKDETQTKWIWTNDKQPASPSLNIIILETVFLITSIWAKKKLVKKLKSYYPSLCDLSWR